MFFLRELVNAAFLFAVCEQHTIYTNTSILLLSFHGLVVWHVCSMLTPEAEGSIPTCSILFSCRRAVPQRLIIILREWQTYSPVAPQVSAH